MEKIKAVIVGLGRIGSLLEEDPLREKPCTHAGAIANNDDCVLAAGCDIDEKRREAFAKKWKVPVYDNAEDMLAHAPQILAIATHPESHYHYCKIAAENKIPVVICEKPLAENIGNAQKIVRLTKQAYAPIIITNHERRYSRDYICAKKIITERSLGSIVSVRAVLYMGKARRLLDMLWHDGTHLVDAIMFLTNSKLKHLRSWGNKLNSRNGTAWLEGMLLPEINQPKLIEVKTPVVIEIGAGRDHLVFEIEFSCENGRLRIGNGLFEVWQSEPSPYAENFRSLKNTGEKFAGFTGYFANMLSDAVECARNPEKIPTSSAINGLKVIEYLNSVKSWTRYNWS